MPRARGGGSSLQARRARAAWVHRPWPSPEPTCRPAPAAMASWSQRAPLQGAVDVSLVRTLCSAVPQASVCCSSSTPQAGSQRRGQEHPVPCVQAVQAGAHVRAGAVREDRGVAGVLTTRVTALHNHGSSGRRRRFRSPLVRLHQKSAGPSGRATASSGMFG